MDIDIDIDKVEWESKYGRKLRQRPRFCAVCGRELRHGKEVIEYDTQTGEPLRVEYSLYCIFHFSSNDIVYFHRKTIRS